MLCRLPLGVGLAGSVSEEEVFLCDSSWGFFYSFLSVFFFFLSSWEKNPAAEAIQSLCYPHKYLPCVLREVVMKGSLFPSDLLFGVSLGQ